MDYKELETKCNIEMAVLWKEKSRELLECAIANGDPESFGEAVLWCGKRGNVSRTVKVECRKDYFGQRL